MFRFLFRAFVLVVVAPVLHAADSFLNSDDAFRISVVRSSPGVVVIKLNVADGYALYKDRLALKVDGAHLKIANVRLPVSEDSKYRGESEIVVVYKGDPKGGSVVVDAQGCADVGLCYPPITRRLSIY